MSVDLDTLGLPPEAAARLPAPLRRRLARFLLRWAAGAAALALLPEGETGPRDRFDRCRALLVAGETEAAQSLARELVNDPGGAHWGQRAVGEVFLALGKAHRADERFRAGADAVGRGRAWLALGKPETALEVLRDAPPEDPEAEAARLGALEALKLPADEVRRHLAQLLEEETNELREDLGLSLAETELLPTLAGPPTPELLREALERVYGYAEFRPGQVDTILPLLNGTSVLGLMPTGAGKSLCFQLPAAMLPGATVVISPLIALMKDQVEGLPPVLYRRATLINSSLEPGEANRRMEAIARGEVSLIYAAPERLRQRAFVRALERRGVSLFVIDEAHCVSLWGHDFRPDYFFIRQVLRDLGSPTVLALTATATRVMQDDIGRQLGVELQTVNLGTFRPNLQFAAYRASDDSDKRVAVLKLLAEEPGSAIIYVDRRKLAEEVAEKLREAGITAEAYHAGMDRQARDRTQDRFMRGEARVIAATVAFGMGVDKADVRMVIHYNLPRSLEAYYQEAGRAGRDGLHARCVLLYTSYDKGNLTRRSSADRLQASDVLDLHRSLVRRLRGGMTALSADELEADCGGDPTRVRVAISLLQDIGAVHRGYDVPGSIWVAPVARDFGESAVSERFREFARAVGLNGRGLAVPAAKIAALPAFSLETLEGELLDWQEAGWIRFRASGRGMGLRAAAEPGLKEAVGKRLKLLEAVDTQRLEQLFGFLVTRECRQGYVSRYFGTLEPLRCGICDNCAARAPAMVAEPRRKEVAGYLATEAESALYERLRAWRREKAREEQLPAYVIFHDRVLYAIAQQQPRTRAALAQVTGVGPTKIAAYGNDIVALVRGDQAKRTE